MKKAFYAVLTAALASTGAAAQPFDEDRWSGPYVGGSLGYGFGDSSLGVGASPVQTITTTTTGPATTTPDLCETGRLGNIPILDNSLIIGSSSDGGRIYSDAVAEILQPSNPLIGGGGPGGTVANFLDFNNAAVLTDTGCLVISGVFKFGAGGYRFGFGGDGTVIPGSTIPGTETTSVSRGLVGPLSEAGPMDQATLAAIDSVTGAGTGRSVDVEGAYGTVHAGYGVIYNAIYFGAEGEFGFGDISGDVHAGAFALDSDLDLIGSLRLRVGKPFGSILPYVAGGFAFGRGELEYSLGNVRVSDRRWHAGGTIGAGVEWALTENVAARAEYSFTHLAKQTYLSAEGYAADQDFDINRVSLGLTWRY